MVWPASGESVLAQHTKGSDAIVVAEVVKRTPSLSHGDSWVTSPITARIVDLLKTPTVPREFRVGENFDFVEEGGEVVVRGTQVLASVPGLRPLRPGARYLLFLV
jgi:hypothetical protein